MQNDPRGETVHAFAAPIHKILTLLMTDLFIPLLGRRLDAAYFCTRVLIEDIHSMLNQLNPLFDFVDGRKMLDTLERGNQLNEDPLFLLVETQWRNKSLRSGLNMLIITST